MTNAFSKTLKEDNSLLNSTTKGTNLAKSLSESVRRTDSLTRAQSARQSMGTNVATDTNVMAGNALLQNNAGNWEAFKGIMNSYREIRASLMQNPSFFAVAYKFSAGTSLEEGPWH